MARQGRQGDDGTIAQGIRRVCELERKVLAYAATGAPLYYWAPLDVDPVWIRYEGRARTVRVFPPGCTGRGRRRTSDPFSADAGHLDRFFRKGPCEAPCTCDVILRQRNLPEVTS
jgi:hypothetical protein